jgi:hypothetical protein
MRLLCEIFDYFGNDYENNKPKCVNKKKSCFQPPLLHKANAIALFFAFAMFSTMRKTPSKPPRTPRVPALNPNEERPENCYCSAFPRGSGPCLPCYSLRLRLAEGKHSGGLVLRPHSG